MNAARVVREAPLAHLRWDGPAGAATVLLLHGIGGGRESFGDALSGTGRALHAAGFSVVAVDLPGYGDSPASEPYDMAALATALAAQVAAVPGRVAVVGHSLGGMVAQEYLARRAPGTPAPLAALVLMGTSPAFGRPEGAWQREFLAQRLAPLDAGQGMSGLAPGLVAGMASPHAAHDAVARAALLMSAVPEATYRRALAALVGFDRRDALEGLQVPTLCLAGADDRNAPPAVMQRMAQRIPGAAFECLPGVGHLMHMEAPQAVHAALIDFLQRTL
ncbi:MAG TPA: alpha/beta fold hydrolase [Burkholderiaceae bacterium]|nr:alpha/beta fold hydrolase [Burkholderiaceae bacterium]